MQDPLKQGLKLSLLNLDSLGCSIRMQDPLKQGLKHSLAASQVVPDPDSNARSTKTRIET